MKQKCDPSSKKVKKQEHSIVLFHEKKVYFTKKPSIKQCFCCMHSTHHCTVVHVHIAIQNISIELVLINVLVKQSIKQ